MPNPHEYEDYLPLWGNFAFFTVGPNSFHTVREVTSQLPRLAVSGWFHGEELAVPQLVPTLFPKLETFPPILPCPQFALNPLFASLSAELERKLSKNLRLKGALFLSDFVSADFLSRFPLSESSWVDCGPMHLRHYLRCVNPTGLIHAVQTGKELLLLWVFFDKSKIHSFAFDSDEAVSDGAERHIADL